MPSGEGGIVATNDPQVYQRAALFSNCGMPWYRYGLSAPRPEPVAGMPTRGHFAFGHNYRLGELPGAVALAQLAKIGGFNARRRELVAIMEEELRGVDGIELAHVYPETEPNYWAYPVRVPSGLGTYGEINYLEVVFQEMQRSRRTSVGVPLPDYVRYEPGICPRSEAAARRMRPTLVHHSAEPEVIRGAARAIREDVERAGARS